MDNSQFEQNQELFGITGLSDGSDRKLTELNERLNLLFKIGQYIDRISGKEELLSRLLDMVCEVLNAQYGSIMTVHEGNTLKISASKGISESVALHTEVHSGESISGFVLESGKPVWVPDISRDEYFSRFIKKDRHLNLSFLSSPVIFRGEKLGVINLCNKISGEFTREDLNLLSFFASQLSIILKNSSMISELSQKALEHKILFRLSETLNSTMNFKQNIQKFFKLLARNLDLSEIGIALYRKETRDYIFSFGYRMNNSTFQNYMRSILLNSHQDYFFTMDSINTGRKLIYFRPLQYENEIMGLFLFTKNYEDSHSSTLEFSFIKSLANQISVSLMKEDLIHRINQDNNYFKDLNRFNEKISSSPFDLDRIGSEMVTMLHKTFGLDAAGVFFSRMEPALMIYCNSDQHDLCSEIILNQEIPRFFPRLCLSGLRRNDISSKRKLSRIDNFRFTMTVPMMSNQEKIGLIFIAGRRERLFTEKQQRQLFLLIHQFTLAYENLCLFRQNEKLAFTDPITEIFNHRYFITQLKKEFHRARRYSHPLSLLILDIDHFKQFNDRFGHLQGDLILKTLGKVLNSNIRNDLDTAARYGGEEFVIIVPITDQTGAVELAERVRTAIESYPFPSIRKKKTNHQVTVSIGVTTFRENTFLEPEQMIAVADKALYEAKNNGRNRCVFFEPDMCKKEDQ